MESDFRLTGHVMTVLATFLRDPAIEWYGFDLAKQTNVARTSIYPILARLLTAGWLERRWEEIDRAAEGRAPRRLYRLTAVGQTSARHALDEHLATLQRLGHTSGPTAQRRLRPA